MDPYDTPTVPSAAHRPPPPGRGLWLAAGSLVLLAVVAGIGLGSLQLIDLFSPPEETSETIDAGVERIVVDVGSDDVRITGSDRTDITVSQARRGVFAEHDNQVRREGDTLTVTGACSSWFVASCSTVFELDVPHGVSVELTGGSGNIGTEDVHGALDLELGSGDIEAVGTIGDVVATVTSGNVEVRESESPNVEATATSGDVTVETLADAEAISAASTSGNVTVDAGGAVGSLTANAESGDVTIETAADAQTIDAATTSGNVTLGIGAAFGSLTADAESGDVQVTVPTGGGPYAVDADTSSGDIDAQVPQDPEGPPVRLRAGSGNVSIDTD
ncbi:DUF4097 family beta strand repeat-containing protein [Allonocardiopsis opalescens]|uniref:Putative adhesin n=1 Tax=Allonocardiopsis opalescens TaxID=1144618 RepID=A0A2T0QAW7_9ACTN|nr:DUF4097 family beta strand repeat-containing protein [Allonocardiopsis opalescens]PRY00960.1 putative adhesin [Allonocardiopsis opalescens]